MILINRTEEVPCVVFHADGGPYRHSILAAEDRIRVGLLDTIPPRVIVEMRNFFHFDEDLYFSFVANGHLSPVCRISSSTSTFVHGFVEYVN
jgi:hypothetical protein